MDTSYIALAQRLDEMAKAAMEDNRVGEGFALLEKAITLSMMVNSKTPIAVKLLPRQWLPRPIASVDHAIVQVSAGGIVIQAALELVTRTICDFRRFPLVGDLFSQVSRAITGPGAIEAIIDLGDGDDLGDYPRIAYSSSRSDCVLVPDPYFYFNDNNAFYRAYADQQGKPWRQRDPVIFWRGGSGGRRLSEPDPSDPLDWSCQQRLQLCAAVRRSAFAEHLDVALTHLKPISEAYLREAIEREGFLQPEVPKLQFFGYRHLIDIDGWTNAWSLLDKMIGGATILKVASAFGYRQWFYARLAAWRNYIPLAADCADLDEKIGWVLGHPDQCEEIAARAAATANDIHLAPDLAAAAQAVVTMFRS